MQFHRHHRLDSQRPNQRREGGSQLQREFLREIQFFLQIIDPVAVLFQPRESGSRSNSITEVAKFIDQTTITRIRCDPDSAPCDSIDLLNGLIAVAGDSIDELVIAMLNRLVDDRDDVRPEFSQWV